jgi:hypothetical protein
MLTASESYRQVNLPVLVVTHLLIELMESDII